MLIRGELIDFDSDAWTATIRLWTSIAVVLTDVPVAHHIPQAHLAAGAQIAVLTFDPSNPADAVIVASYGDAPDPTVETTDHDHDDDYVNLSGDTMTGALTVEGDVNVDDDLDVAGHAAFGSAGTPASNKIIAVSEYFTDTSGTQFALQFNIASNPTSNRTGTVYGVVSRAVHGAAGSGDFTGSKTLVAGSFEIYNDNTSHAVGVAIALTTFGKVASGGSMQSLYHFRVGDTEANGTINNVYGLFVPEITAGANNNYAIYTAGNTLSYFGGIVQTNDRFRLPVLSGAPSSPQNGDIAYANGSSWNPGSGAGFYGYEGGTWVKL